MRRLTWFALRVWYYNFSKKYRAVFERQYRDWYLPEFKSLSDLTETIGRMKWRRDGYRELWDAISDPRAVYAKHCMGYAGAMDCDDISIFAADRIRDMHNRGVLPAVRTIGLLSVPWIDEKGKINGHNVCAFSYVEAGAGLCWAHVSNWHGGAVQFQGVGGERLVLVEDVVRAVLKGRTSIGWSLADVDLRPIRYGDGSDI